MFPSRDCDYTDPPLGVRRLHQSSSHPVVVHVLHDGPLTWVNRLSPRLTVMFRPEVHENHVPVVALMAPVAGWKRLHHLLPPEVGVFWSPNAALGENRVVLEARRPDREGRATLALLREHFVVVQKYRAWFVDEVEHPPSREGSTTVEHRRYDMVLLELRS